MLVLDRQGQIVLVNARIEQLFGYQREELTRRPVEVLIPQRFASAHARHRQRYVSDPRIRPMGADLELYGRRKDGTEFPVDLMLGPLDTDEGLFVVAVIRDDTERRKAELERQRIVALANESVEFIGMCDRDFQPFYVNAAGIRLVASRCPAAAPMPAAPITC